MKKNFALLFAGCLSVGMFIFAGCQKEPIPKLINSETDQAAFAVDGNDIPFSRVEASSSLLPATALNDSSFSTIWSSNTHTDQVATEWVSYSFSDSVNINYIKLYPRYLSGVAYGFPVNFDIYLFKAGSWEYFRSYASFPTPQKGWVVLPFSPMVNTEGIKIVATRMGLDDNAIPVFQLAEVAAGLENRIICIDDPLAGPPIHSTYSPWVMHGPGWDRYRMYFGRNEIVNGVSADRIYLSENMGDGRTGWNKPILLITPGGSGQGALIHDPTVVIVDGVWQMFYTGTDGPDNNNHYNNRVFHATSNDGVTWQKQGQTSIAGLPAQNGSYGCGEPSVIYENGTYYLYFFSDTDPVNGTVGLATGTDGSNFTYYGVVSKMIVTSPEVKKNGDNYILLGSSAHVNIVKQTSSDMKSFGSNFTQIFSTGPEGSWDFYHVGHPDFLPNENRLYYSGTTNDWLGSSEMDDGKIGVANITF